jgi:hypothetical protein
MMEWRDLEREVATIFRVLGAEVEHDVAVAGNQVDVVVREQTASGRRVTTVIECKALQRPVGVAEVNALAGLHALFRQRGLADVAMVVSTGGFSRQAREAASAHGVELVELDDLRQRVVGRTPALALAASEIRSDDERREQSPRQPRAFVAMPFDPVFNDVYVLGIREVAERVGYVVERVDEVEHNGLIVDVIAERLRTCDLLIADTTTKNPNVFYEVGFAHAIDKPTVLICREGETLPFDVASTNHIMYSSIVDLRERLEKRLRATGPGQT